MLTSSYIMFRNPQMEVVKLQIIPVFSAEQLLARKMSIFQWRAERGVVVQENYYRLKEENQSKGE